MKKLINPVGNLVTKRGIEKMIRAPKDYDPTLGA